MDQRADYRTVARQPHDLDPGRRRQFLCVSAQRHLAERRTDRVTRQVAQDPGDRRQRRLVPHEQDPTRVAGRELDAAVRVAAARRHHHQPVADLGLRRPGAARPGLAVVITVVVTVQHDVDHQPAVLSGPDDLADRVGPHVAALLLGALDPRLPPGLVGTRERRHRAVLVREDQLDALVEVRAVAAQLGERRAAELEPHEARREPVGAEHLDLFDEHVQIREGDVIVRQA